MKKLIITFALLITLVGSIFATDWKSAGVYENKSVGTYEVFYDADASKPFEDENLSYLKYLKNNYKKVTVTVYEANGSESNWFTYNVYNNGSFSTLEIYKDYVIEDHINVDGLVTEYICYR